MEKKLKKRKRKKRKINGYYYDGQKLKVLYEEKR